MLEELEKREVMTTLNFSVINNTGFQDSSIYLGLYGQVNGNWSYVQANNSNNVVNNLVNVANVADVADNALASAPFAFATMLSANLTTGCTTVPVTSLLGNAPAGLGRGATLKIGNEVMIITGSIGSNYTVLRGQFGTTASASSYTIGATVLMEQYVPVYTLNSFSNYTPGSNGTRGTGVFSIDGCMSFVSGRLVIGVANPVISPLQFTHNGTTANGGGINPANAKSSVDPNANFYWDFAEPTWISGANAGLFVDTSQVDATGFPITLSLTIGNTTTAPTGIPGNAAITRADIIANYALAMASTSANHPFTTGLSLAPRGGGLANATTSSPANGTVTRILSPEAIVALAPTLYTTGNLTAGSNVISAVSNADQYVIGGVVSVNGNGSAIPPGSTITNFTGTTLTLSANATTTLTGANLTIVNANLANLAGLGNTVGGNAVVGGVAANVSALASYFNTDLNNLFTNAGNITLIVPNPGFGRAGTFSVNDPATFTFVGNATTITGNDITSNITNYPVLAFTYNGTIGNAAAPTFYVYKPYFKTNMPASAGNFPLPPQYFANTINGNLSNSTTPGGMVLAGDGVFADNVQQWGPLSEITVTANETYSSIQGNLENQIVAALNRGVSSLGRGSANTTGVWRDQTLFYGNAGASNAYAAFLHGTIAGLGNVAIDQRAYAISYDDQANFSTTQAAPNATGAIFTLGEWANSTPPPPPPPPPAVIPQIYAVGSGNGTPSQAQVFAANGTLLANLTPFGSFTGGVRVAVGDVNNDGFQDLIASAGRGGNSRVLVLSGQNNFQSVLASFYAFEGFDGGTFVAAGNVDSDADMEVLVGAGVSGGPRVSVFNITGGQAVQMAGPLGSFYAYDLSYDGGVTVAAANIDGVGLDEIITGPASNGGPNVRIFDTNTNPVYSFYAFSSSFIGGIFVAAADLNGDTFAEVLVGPASQMGPMVNIFTPRQSVTSSQSITPTFGSSFTGGVRVGTFDINNNGQADIVLGSGPGLAGQLNFFFGNLTMAGNATALEGSTNGVFVS